MAPSELSDIGEKFRSRRLFYPASGKDLREPIQAFLPYIDEFWFVDPKYEVDQPLLAGFHEFDLNDRTGFKIRGTTMRRNEPFMYEAMSERYSDKRSNRTFTVKVCCGRGYDVFRTCFRKTEREIAVFF